MSEASGKDEVVEVEKEECCSEFRKKLRQGLGGGEELPDGQGSTAEVVRDTECVWCILWKEEEDKDT